VVTASFANLVSREDLGFGSPPDFPLNGSEPKEKDNWPGWEAQLAQWRSDFDQLATDYAQGAAPVDPLDGSVCRYCHRQPLCRVFEGQVEEVDDGEDER